MMFIGILDLYANHYNVKSLDEEIRIRFKEARMMENLKLTIPQIRYIREEEKKII
jgi:hypothetical protein